MIQEILSICTPSEINDCITDILHILKQKDFISHPYFKTSIKEVDQENMLLSQSIGTVRSSKYAEILKKTDKYRDRMLSGLTQVSRASMLRGDEDIAKNATEVYRIIKAHGLDLRHKSYQSESAGIDSIVSELNSESMQAMIDTLPESKAFLVELASANQTFKKYFDENMAYKASIVKLNSPSIQVRIVRNLFNSKLVQFINMMSEIEPENFKTLANKIAPYTDKINLNAKLHKSRKKLAASEETAVN